MEMDNSTSQNAEKKQHKTSTLSIVRRNPDNMGQQPASTS